MLRCCVCSNTRFLSMCGACNQVIYCGYDCQKQHWSSKHQQECKRPIVIVAPHTCLHPKPPHCDTNSAEFARLLYDALKEKEPFRLIKLYESNKYRFLCDPNRVTCQNDTLRVSLRKFMHSYPNAYILEIHSFPKETLEGDWRTLSPDTQSVILSVHNMNAFERLVVKGTQSAVLEGSKTVNDISLEAIKNGWTHVLFEIRYDADLQKLRDDFVAIFTK